MDKRLIFLFAVAFVATLLQTSPASGQTSETPAIPAASASAGRDSVSRQKPVGEPTAADSLERLDPVDSDLVALRRSAAGEEVVLEVAGFGITLSGPSGGRFQPADPEKPKSRVSPTLLAGTEYGYNVLTGLDYGAYPAGTDRFFDLLGGKSFHLSSTLVGLAVDLGRRRHFKFSTGLRYTIDNYRLSDPSITLGNEAGMIVPVALDERADKSKLRITSLGFPLTCSGRLARNLSVAVTGYFDFTMGANSIYKRPKVKSSLAGVNTFRFGVGAAVAYYGIGVYVRYSVTPLFESQAGPEVRPLSIGLCLDM